MICDLLPEQLYSINVFDMIISTKAYNERSCIARDII